MRLRGSTRVRCRLRGRVRCRLRGRCSIRGRDRLRVRGGVRVRSRMGCRVMLLMRRSDGMKQMGDLHPIFVCRVVDMLRVRGS